MKPYERENIIIKKLRQCRNSKQYVISMINATKRDLERHKKTYERDVKIYGEELEKAHATITNLDKKILDYSNDLKEFLPKPKPKIIAVDPKSVKVACKYCKNEYFKPGIKSHEKACLKKIELAKLRKQIEKLEIEETLEELDKKEDAEIIEVVEEIIDVLEDSIDLDELTEDVSFIEIKSKEELPKEGD